MNKLLATIDAAMKRDFSAKMKYIYCGDDLDRVIVYESAGQRFLVEIRDGACTVYSFTANGGK